MERYTASEWQFGLWSSLALELIARAALANISPALLASRDDWRNIHHALGNSSTKKGFTPKSATTKEVLSILKELLPDFNDELRDFCIVHCARRNAELHSGEGAFMELGTSAWLGKFYASCEGFLRSMGRKLDDIFRDPITAQAMIAALLDTAAKAVAQEIQAHQRVWKEKSPDEQRLASEQAATWATRYAGHRVICPACRSAALIKGSGQGAVTTVIDEEEDEVVQKQTMLPSSFECVACGLKISGLSKLSACGLGDAFTASSTFSPAEFFELHTDEELDEARAAHPEPEFEEDFNEIGGSRPDE
jgi:hypothetical protein